MNDSSSRSTAVVVLYGSAGCVKSCLASIPNSTEVILVENLPGDGSVEAALEIRPDAMVLRPGGNLGFGEACNLAFSRTQTPYLLLLNPDAILEGRCLEDLVAHIEEHPTCAAVGPLVLRSSDGRIDTAGMEVLAPGWTRDRCRGMSVHSVPPSGSVECLSAGVLLLRKSALQAIQRFPDAFWGSLFLYNEDVELSFSLSAGGWELHFLASARAFHAVGGSRPARRPVRAMAARNRLVTGLVHFSPGDFRRPLRLLRWTWRILMDTPRLLDNLLIPTLRETFWPLLKQVPQRRVRLARKHS